MALEGSLRDFDLFSLFNMIKTQGKSGTLVLTRGQEFVKVFFDQGDIVGCESNQVRVEERVGAMLVRLGRLSNDELASMIQQQRQTLKRMGSLLLESGKISSQDLQDALFNQAMSIIYRTFRWVEGDYRFDSILPLELDRDNFPPIPVDTVLMEAARVMDEWPQVQKRLPDHSTPLCKTPEAAMIRLDIDHDMSGLLDGHGGQGQFQSSGLTHEQETVLTYFAEPQSIQSILQITRYDELETCKIILDLMEMKLLEVAAGLDVKVAPPWQLQPEVQQVARVPDPPTAAFWLMVGILVLAPVLTYVSRDRSSVNQVLASFQSVDVLAVNDPLTVQRKAWVFRMASPKDGGLELAQRLNSRQDLPATPAPDLTKQPDPLQGP